MIGALRINISCKFAKQQLANVYTGNDQVQQSHLRQMVKCGEKCYTLFTVFFGYKTEFFSFQNTPKNLDLYLWDCFGRVKLV